ncbi:DUF547 domain-containing protein [Gemmatimonas sp.]|uniref:DUF547 domain-containing protein n=1 Tax=Gemmatimonas sp. TaxID=1962908 RepID=UPI00286E78D9|nr:DUF547 domain-containing protein [Gemmatimonas sp.]
MPNNQFVLIAILYTMSFSLRRVSKVARRWVPAVLFAAAPVAAPVAAQSAAVPPPTRVPTRVPIDHSAFDGLLRAHVTDGLVDYDAFRDAAAFRRYLTSLERVSLAGADDEEQLAFWINAYNAYTIQLIVAHGERESIRNIDRTLGVLRLKGPWSEPIVRAAGRTLSLDEVEHRIIRKDFKDPRIHFALVSAAKGSPPLRSEAYTGAELDRQLFDQGRRFLKDTTRNQIETPFPRLSPIFTYYRSDFGNSRSDLGAYLATWFDGETKKTLESGRFGMREIPFDWSLNAKAVTRR